MSEQVSVVRLGSIVKIKKGKKPASIESKQLDGSYFPYILIDGFSGSYTHFTNDVSCVKVEKEDIEIVWDGARAGLVSRGHQGYLGSTLAAISLNDNRFDERFVYFTLQHNQAVLRNGTEGTGIPHLSKWVIENFSIYNLSKIEQQKIASILTSVDDIIEKTQSQINKLQDLKKATMNELLTRGIGHTEFKDSEFGKIPSSWQIRPLKSLGECIRGLTYSPKNVSTNGLLVLRSSNIQDDEIAFEI